MADNSLDEVHNSDVISEEDDDHSNNPTDTENNRNDDMDNSPHESNSQMFR